MAREGECGRRRRRMRRRGGRNMFSTFPKLDQITYFPIDFLVMGSISLFDAI